VLTLIGTDAEAAFTERDLAELLTLVRRARLNAERASSPAPLPESIHKKRRKAKAPPTPTPEEIRGEVELSFRLAPLVEERMAAAEQADREAAEQAPAIGAAGRN
jgi:hypothetical protein